MLNWLPAKLTPLKWYSMHNRIQNSPSLSKRGGQGVSLLDWWIFNLLFSWTVSLQKNLKDGLIPWVVDEVQFINLILKHYHNLIIKDFNLFKQTLLNFVVYLQNQVWMTIHPWDMRSRRYHIQCKSWFCYPIPPVLRHRPSHRYPPDSFASIHCRRYICHLKRCEICLDAFWYRIWTWSASS